MKRSKGEQAIFEVLNDWGIEFFEQQTFQTCKSVKDKLLKFDFYLPYYNTVIEYQGKQHRVFVKHFHKTKEKFYESLANDNLKNMWCAENKIKLLTVWPHRLAYVDVLISDLLKPTTTLSKPINYHTDTNGQVCIKNAPVTFLCV